MSVKIPRPPRTANIEDLNDYLEQIERQLTLVGSRMIDVGNIVAGFASTFTIPVIGCKVGQGQAVALAPPETIEADILWCGYVTANDEVTVRLYNAGSTVDLASGTWGARVFL